VLIYRLQEYQRNPSAIGARTYTPLAEWKFREFNELPHLFRKRLNMSHPYASHYIDQFPKVKTEMIFRTVAFIAGAIVTVLAITSLIDPELFLNFEVTPDRTVLFYVGILTAVWVYAHGTISEENNVFDPEFALRNVIEYTHYEPDHWRGRLHSYDVKREFSDLYKMKIVIFFEEVLSILVTPLLLFVSLPKSSDQIVDFFREFTIHVDGLGYVCSFAEFDFKKGIGSAKKPTDGIDVRDDYYSTKHGKMEASYYGFMGNYGNYVLNQKPSHQGQLSLGLRQQFHPPPAWPSMNSPTLAADLHTSRMGRSERARSGAPARTPRFGPTMPQPSPMASILLDPHHQPSTGSHGNKGSQRPWQQRERPGYTGETNIIEESLEDGPSDTAGVRPLEEEEEYDSRDALDESTWQTSPTKTLSRETSGVTAEEPVAGVVGMIYQFNQAQLNRRPGGVR
jgi:autophagy-related protein 9